MDFKSEYEIKKEIIEIGRRCWIKGWVASNDGNISVKLSENEILTTVTGVSKGFLTMDMIVKVDMDGNLIEGKRKPSSELPMHLMVYKVRKDAGAVLHTHPPYATGFAVSGVSLEDCILPEIILSMGAIPLTPYGTPSTDEVPNSIKPYIETHEWVLMKNHGALTIGKNLLEAYYRMESLEHAAKIIFISRELGGVSLLGEEEVKKLMEVRKKYNIPEDKPMCKITKDNKKDVDDKLVEEVVKRVSEKLKELSGGDK